MSTIAVLSIQKDEDVKSPNEIPKTDFLKSVRPAILLFGTALIPTLAAHEVFLESFLVIYLKEKYQTDINITGTILMVCAAFGLLSSVLFGFLTDNGFSRTLVIVGGGVIVVVGTLLIDTSLFSVGWKSYVYAGVMFGLVEVASSAVQVSVLPLMVFHDKEPDVELSTEKMIRVFNSGFFIGSSVGPLVGSALLDFVSFPEVFAIFSALTFLVFLIVQIVHLRTGNLLSLKCKLVDSDYSLLESSE